MIFSFLLHFPFLQIFEVLRNYRCEPNRDRWPISGVGFVYYRSNLEIYDDTTYDESDTRTD